MTFLQPGLLWMLPLAALPVIVHLLNLRRHRKVDWGAMQFLLQATRQRRGHTRLRHLLILLSRVLAIAALALVISRPMAGRWFGLLSGRPDTVIVIMDRSPSMSQQDIQSNTSKRSMAIRQIVSAIERVGQPPNLALIESASQTPQVVAVAQSLLEIPETGASDAPASLPRMLQEALSYVVENQSGRTDIWICSDLQSADWDAENGQWNAIRKGFAELKQPVRFHLLAYTEPPRDNLSVRVQKLNRKRTADNDELVMDIRLRRHAQSTASGDRPPQEDPLDVRLDVVVDGARSVVEVQMTGNSMVVSGHTVPLDRERTSGWGKVELPNDINPRDNVFFFTYGDSLARRTLVVSDEPGAAWPLRLAAAPEQEIAGKSVNTDASNEGSTASVVSAGELESIDWLQASLVLWQSALPGPEIGRRLEAYVDAGGQIIFFPPSNDGSGAGIRSRAWQHDWRDWCKLSDQPDSGTESSAESERRSTDEVPSAAARKPHRVAQSVARWRDDSGLVAHADDGEPLPMTRLVVHEYRRIDGDGQVLARLNSGAPLLLRASTDRGGVYFCSTLPQMPYSNLAREGVVFYVMIQRALAAGAERVLANQFGEIRLAGTTSSQDSPVVIDFPPDAVGSTDAAVSGAVPHPPIQPLARMAANWQLVEGWSEGNLSTEKGNVAGVFRDDGRLLARNRPPVEDSDARLSVTQLESLLSGLNYRVVEEQVQGGQSLVSEIWRLFAVLILAALIVEAVLCMPDVRPKTLVPA